MNISQNKVIMAFKSTRQSQRLKNNRSEGQKQNQPFFSKTSDHVQGKSNNTFFSSPIEIQKQPEKETPKLHAVVEENSISDDVIIKGFNNLGSFSYIDSYSKKRVHEFVLTGTKEQWSKMLEHADDLGNFMTFIIGFLKASNDPNWVTNADSNPFKSIDRKVNILRAPNESEKLEFLKALYSVEIDTDLDLVDKWFEKGVFSGEGVTTPVLAEFIGKNQHLLIKYMSEKSKDQHLKQKGIDKVATQGTPNLSDPVVVQNMLQSSFASAVSASKLIILDSIKDREHQDTMEALNSTDIVANSAIVIKTAITSYGKKVQSLKDGIGIIFDIAWNAIPASKTPLAKLVTRQAKTLIKAQLLSSLSFPVNDNLNEEYALKYASIIKSMAQGILEEHEDTNIDRDRFVNAYRDLISIFKNYIQ